MVLAASERYPFPGVRGENARIPLALRSRDDRSRKSRTAYQEHREFLGLVQTQLSRYLLANEPKAFAVVRLRVRISVQPAPAHNGRCFCERGRASDREHTTFLQGVDFVKRLLSAPVVLAVSLFVVSGCSKPTAPPQATSSTSPTSPSPLNPDPVAEFKEVLSRFVAGAKPLEISYYASNSTEKVTDVPWPEEKPIETSYDVTKTDSLVSPLRGAFLYSYPKDPRFGSNPSHWKAIFAYQEKKWVLRRTCYTTVYGNTYCDDDSDAAPVAAEERTRWESVK